MTQEKIAPPNSALVGKSGQNDSYFKMYINSNKLLSKEQRKTKPTPGDIQRFNSIDNITEHCITDIPKFLEFLNEGNTIYSGIFKKGAKKLSIEDVEKSYLIFVDIDGGDFYSFLDNNYDFIQTHGFIAQPSISTDPINITKFHIFLWLDEPVYNDDDYKKVWEWVYSNLDFSGCQVDKSKKGINNLIFFSDKNASNHYKKEFETNPLNTKEIIEQQDLLLKQIEENNSIDEIDDLSNNLDEKVNAQFKEKTRKKRRGITQKVLDFIYEKIYVEICDSDIDKLYCLHDHKFRERRVSGSEAKLGITQKWDGSNPFSQTNSTGTSLCVSQFGNQLPLFFDRSGNYNEKGLLENKYRNGGTFLSYWWECGKLGILKELGIKRNAYTGTLQDKGKFTSVLTDITKYFGCEKFDFRKSNSLINVKDDEPTITVGKSKPPKESALATVPSTSIVPSETQLSLDINNIEKTELNVSKTEILAKENEDKKQSEPEKSEEADGLDNYEFDDIMEELEKFIIGKIYHCQWEDGLYLYFSPTSKTWQYTKSIAHIISHVIQPLVKQIYGDRHLTRSQKLIELVTRRIETECSVEYGKLDHPPEDDVTKTPFLNGVYDLVTGKLYDYYDPEVSGYIHYYVIPWEFKEVSDNNRTIKKFHAHFKTWLHSEAKANTLLSWTILNIQRQAYLTGKMVGLSGQSGAGKSTFGEYLIALFGQRTSNFAIKVDPNELTGSNSTHATAALEGRNVFVMDEFRGDTYNTSVDKLKSFTGQNSEHGILVTINPKNFKHRSIRLKAAFTWNRQGGIELKDDDQGFNRRTVIIQLDNNCVSEKAKNSWDYLKDESNLETVFNWGIKQDTKKYLEMFKQSYETPEIKDNALQTRKENNPVYQWTEACFYITGDDKDFASTTDAYVSYELWCSHNKFNPLGKIKFNRRLRAILEDSDYFTPEQFSKIKYCQKRVNGSKNAQRGISGVKIVDSDELIIDSIEEENKLNEMEGLKKSTPESFDKLINN